MKGNIFLTLILFLLTNISMAGDYGPGNNLVNGKAFFTLFDEEDSQVAKVKCGDHLKTKTYSIKWDGAKVYKASIQLNDDTRMNIVVNGHTPEETFIIEYLQAEQPTITASTYGGHDLSVRINGSKLFSCELL